MVGTRLHQELRQRGRPGARTCTLWLCDIPRMICFLVVFALCVAAHMFVSPSLFSGGNSQNLSRAMLIKRLIPQASLLRTIETPVVESNTIRTVTLSPKKLRYQLFKEKFGSDDKNKIIQILQILSSVFKEHDIDAMLYGGSVLSHCRHGRHLNPFDDDVDVLVSADQVGLLKSILTEHHPNLQFIGAKEGGSEYNSDTNFKVFYADSPHAGKYKWKYPYIDLFAYNIVEQNIVVRYTSEKVHSYPKSVLLPIKMTQFENMTFGIPAYPSKYLSLEFGSAWRSECVVSSYDHKNEMHDKIILRAKHAEKSLPCVDLMRERPSWPFELVCD